MVKVNKKEQLVFEARIENGKIRIVDLELWKLQIGNLEGKDIQVIIDQEKFVRSPKSNRYMWGWVYKNIIAELEKHTGTNKNKLHGMMKAMFAKDMVEFNGSMYECVGSTAVMSSQKFYQFVNDVKNWAMEEFNIQVPPTIREMINEQS